jgi:MerR family redox-sensitive transcriptional activator SoxR
VKDLDITEVTRRTGVPASTLRFYEERGLITSTGRRSSRRVLDARVMDRLALIALGQAAGFSLTEIAEVFASDGRLRIQRERLTTKAEELDRTIRRLVAIRNALRRAAACPSASHMECPKFRRILRLASKARGRSPERGAR